VARPVPEGGAVPHALDALVQGRRRGPVGDGKGVDEAAGRVAQDEVDGVVERARRVAEDQVRARGEEVERRPGGEEEDAARRDAEHVLLGRRVEELERPARQVQRREAAVVDLDEFVDGGDRAASGDGVVGGAVPAGVLGVVGLGIGDGLGDEKGGVGAGARGGDEQREQRRQG